MMMKSKKQFIDTLVEIEGGYDAYTDNPDDSGGKTKGGVTEREARAYGYIGDVRNLPASVIFDIYEQRFWQPLYLDHILPVSEKLTEELLDTGVNMGHFRAASYLQRCLNVLNMRKKYYPDISVDGRIGPKTLAALKAFLNKRGRQGETVLLRMMNCLQGAGYIDLAESREKDETFIYGWMLNRVKIEKGA